MEHRREAEGAVPGRAALPEWGAFPELRLVGDAERLLVDDHRTSSSKTHRDNNGTILSRTVSATQVTRLLLLPAWMGGTLLHQSLEGAEAACLTTITWPRTPEPAERRRGRAIEALVGGAVVTVRTARPPSGWDEAVVMLASLPRRVPGRAERLVGVDVLIALRGIAVPERLVVDIVPVDAYLRGRDRMIREIVE